MENVDQQMKTMVLLQALWTIAQESRDVESVRLAIATMTNCDEGIQYLAMNPIKS